MTHKKERKHDVAETEEMSGLGTADHTDTD